MVGVIEWPASSEWARQGLVSLIEREDQLFRSMEEVKSTLNLQRPSGSAVSRFEEPSGSRDEFATPVPAIRYR